MQAYLLSLFVLPYHYHHFSVTLNEELERKVLLRMLMLLSFAGDVYDEKKNHLAPERAETTFYQEKLLFNPWWLQLQLLRFINC